MKKQNNQTKRVALYARVSTLDKGQDPQTQLEQLRDYAQRRNFEVIGEFIDHASGTTQDRIQYKNEWVETGTAAAYGGGRNMLDTSSAPGNLSFYGSAGSIYPEDYNEAGSLWDHLQRNKKDFFNFGFGLEMAANYSDSTMKHIGELYTVNYPVPAPILDKSPKLFPSYNMAISDQFREDVFIKEFKEKWTGDGKMLPSMLTLMLPNDHGTNERPDAGFPFQESYMADNDLALGRTIEFLSHTPY